VLCYGSEAWTIRKSDERRIIACEMKFMRQRTGYTKWDLKRNEEVLKELKVEPILDYIYRYQNNWKEHVNSNTALSIKGQEIIRTTNEEMT
jgi:hypothetical protein